MPLYDGQQVTFPITEGNPPKVAEAVVHEAFGPVDAGISGRYACHKNAAGNLLNRLFYIV